MTRILAPMSGWLAPLDEVADPVFASRSMGDGFAIDPVEGLVGAPCDGTIAAVAPTGHSITIDVAGGATILIHVGLDTVALKGEGFEPLVEAGAKVAAGDPLIRFDMAAVGLRARSLLTPVIVIGEGDRIALQGVGRLVARGEWLADVEGGSAASDGVEAETVRRVTVPMPHGIHARPAARIVEALKPFAAQVELRLAERRANARSVVALLKLAVGHGDEIVITAAGPGAAAAADAVAALIASGMGEERPAAIASIPSGANGGSMLRGVMAAPGLAIGAACHLGRIETPVPEQGRVVDEERAALRDALKLVGSKLEAAASGPAAEIGRAHQELLADPELLAEADRHIAAGKSAAFGWRSAMRENAAALAATGDTLLKERVADLVDLERQVISVLIGAEATMRELPSDAILIADDLLPSEFQALDRSRLTGIALAAGGPTSHVAILAASAGVPMLVALGDGAHAIEEGATLILDADGGALDTAPGQEAVEHAKGRLAGGLAAHAEAQSLALHAARTADGTRIEVMANLGAVEEASEAAAAGADGCGLLRTEFLFLDRERAPDEEEQARIYGAIAQALGDRPLIVRTFDIGGDKPVPYLPMPAELNPALGMRGVRLNLQRSDLLDVQLRAILRGVPAGQRRIMVPMVIEPAELRQVRDRLRRAEAELGITQATPLGVMIETPAAALLADAIAAEADFLSIGSNDLTQYALACDRGNAALAARVDPLHPAVLRLVDSASRGALAHGRWLGLCGGMASDPDAVPLLIGLGVTELSVAPARIAAIKARVRKLDLAACRTLAERALQCSDAAAVRALIRELA